MNPETFPADLARELSEYLDLCREFLALFTEENQALRRPQPASPGEFNAQRKRLLRRLESGLIKLRSFRHPGLFILADLQARNIFRR